MADSNTETDTPAAPEEGTPVVAEEGTPNVEEHDKVSKKSVQITNSDQEDQSVDEDKTSISKKSVPIVLDESMHQKSPASSEFRLEDAAVYLDETIAGEDDFLEEENPYEAMAKLLDEIVLTATESLEGSSYDERLKEFEPDEDLISIDRPMYYELYDVYYKKYRAEIVRSHFLQLKVADYYKARRMFHVLYTDRSAFMDQQKQYEKLLDEFEAVCDDAVREQSEMESDAASLRKKCNAKREELESLWQKFVDQEEGICKELINEKVDQGKKDITARFLYRYLKRQKVERDLITKLRSEYIQLRNKLNEEQEAMEAIENLGPNLRLLDYEHLKMDNRNLTDKMEEKEMVLSQLRRQCQDTNQLLAHTREKVDSIDQNVVRFKEELESSCDDVLDAREQLASLTHDLKYYRGITEKLREHVGLLTRPKLLMDLQLAREELIEGKIKLQEYINGCEFSSNKVKEVQARLHSFFMEMRGNLSEDSSTITPEASAVQIQ